MTDQSAGRGYTVLCLGVWGRVACVIMVDWGNIYRGIYAVYVFYKI